MCVLFRLLKHRLLLISAVVISIIEYQLHMWKGIFRLKFYYSGHQALFLLMLLHQFLVKSLVSCCVFCM